MMRHAVMTMLGGMILSVMMAFGAVAQQTEIEGTITSQIEAFKADDFEQAFSYATPNLQRLFQSPSNFERMVTSGYPMVWRPADVQYLDLQERAGDMYQKVQITDEKGALHLLMYRMQQTNAGWRIGGVQILKMPGATA
jgi:hypothetical protein